MRGRRSKLKSVNDAKITEGSREWPVSVYVTNERTEAKAGKLIATALLADLSSDKERR